MTRRNLVLLIIIALAALVVDQVSKALIVHFLRTPGHSVRVLGSFLTFILTYNPKGVFGLNIAHGIGYYILPLFGILLVIFFARSSQHRGFTACYGLILGGAFGNLIDRIFRHGGVVDFAEFYLAPIGIKWQLVNPWFVFNVADSCLVIGIILLLIFETVSARKPDEESNRREHREDTEKTENVPNPETKPQMNADERGPNVSNPNSEPQTGADERRPGESNLESK